ncbi:M36 family metallopeptidase [Cochleicola gelatinilyticus]|nr:M36 family metallopeptidase [Cochleicola gelatinilyticus]
MTLQLSAQKLSKDNQKGMEQSSVSLENLVKQQSPDYVIYKEHVSRTSGIRHVYLRQAINGLEIYGTESSVHFKQDGTHFLTHNKFLSDAQATVQNAAVSINAQQAIQSVANQMGYQVTTLQQLRSEGGENQKTVFNKAGISEREIPVKLMYYYREGVGTTKVWELSINETDSSDWWNFRVDAGSGQIIDKDNWTVSCNIMGSHEDHAHETSPTEFVGPLEEAVTEKNVPAPHIAGQEAALVGSYNVFPYPIESPNFGSRAIVANPDDAVASPFGWHDTNGAPGPEFTDTRGNNVNTYEAGNNFGFRPDGGAGLSFDFPLNLVYSNGDQSESAILTNLFYQNNFIHDVLYHYGFDEAAGNFQENNYGNGGAGSDSVNAEGQKGLVCNAFFSTPPDGQNPTMEMYVCGNRDGDLDNGVIFHEFGHGVSNRLSSLGGQEQMGEGWSDYFGLILSIEPGDAGTDSRGIGTWLFGEGPNGGGIRTFPYSTDFGVNPHTYDDIKTESVPHGVGSVWNAVLWDMTWLLIDKYGFDQDIYQGTGGNNIALALVMEGLKLQAAQPGFVDGRDGILAADMALYGGANQCEIWEAFAGRGVGFSADQGSSGSRSDGTEAFDLPPTFSSLILDYEVCLADGVQTGLSGGSPEGGVYSGDGVTDDGNGMTFTFDPTVNGAGTTTVSYAVNDFCTGDPITLTEDLLVTDNPPVIVCRGSGTIDMTGMEEDNPGTIINDNVSISTTIDIAEDVVISDLNVGLNITHTWMADVTLVLESPAGTQVTIYDDADGCSANDMVTLLDDESPNALDCDPNGSGSGGEAFPLDSYIPSNLLDAFDGENTSGTWTLTITDDAGGDQGTLNSWSLNYTHQVVSEPLTVLLDSSGNATIDAEDLLLSVEVDCGGYTVEAGSPLAETVSFTSADVGTNNIDVVVTTDTGMTATCTAVAIVMETVGLNILCPADATVECGESTDPDATGMATATSDCDNDPDITFSDTSVAGCGNTEVITRTWTVVDDCENPVASCTQTITVVDTTDPTTVCPDDVIVDATAGTCSAVVTYDAVTGTDTCGTVTVTQTSGLASGSEFPVGTTTNEFTIEDECGNITTCSFTVLVEDGEDPVVTCPDDLTVTVEGADMYTFPDYFASGDATATDNCTGVTTTQDPAPGAQVGEGTTVVTLTATDASGNEVSCNFNVEVIIVLGVDDNALSNSKITLYPNPATKELYLSNPNQVDLENVSLYDLTGRLIKSVNLNDMGTEIRMDISELATATYMVVIKSQNDLITKQLIKQ